MSDIFQGIEDSQKLKPSSIRPEPKGVFEKTSDMTKTNFPAFLCLFASGLMVYSPHYADVAFLFSLIIWFISRKNVKIYPFEIPMDEYDDNSGFKISRLFTKKILKPTSLFEKKKGKGMFFLGNSRSNLSGSWLSKDAVTTHWLVMGSTGSGKTRFLLGVLYQALLTGSGALYVDGKADTTVYWLVYSICRRLGREDDFLVINYLTGGESQSDIPYHKRDIISNTNNPFAYGQPDNLRSMIVSLMRDDGGDGMWKGRASALVGALMKTLCYMRDANMIQLSILTVRKYLNLDEILKIVFNKEIPMKAKRPLIAYLNELPGYQVKDAKNQQLNPKCYEQHGFLQMQLTEALSDMSEVYGHIFSTPMGEVDYKDLVYNRRILFVMLPALEKDPDALANLGKMVVGGVRTALATALGAKVEGSKREVIDTKPTNAFSPFFIILDEYGYYAVKGFAVVAAQARSLNVSCIFAGQDYPSFKKSSEEEAASTVANTNIKICLKLEEAAETFQIFEKRAGQERVSEISGYEMNTGVFSGYNKSQQSTSINMRERINVRDLVSQKAGESHTLFGDTLVRMRMFYADPHEVNDARLNRFLVMLPPSNALIDRYKDIIDNTEKMKSVIAKGNKHQKVDDGNSFANIFKDLTEGVKHLNNTKAGIYAYSMFVLENIKPEFFNSNNIEINQDETFSMDDHEESISDLAERAKNKMSDSKAPSTPYSRNTLGIDSTLNDDVEEIRYDRDSEFSDFEERIQDMSGNIKTSAKSYANLLSRAVDEIVYTGIENQIDRRLNEEEREKVGVKNQLKAREEQLGLSPEAAEYEARRGHNMVMDSVRYPVNPPREQVSHELFKNSVTDIESRLKQIKNKKM